MAWVTCTEPRVAHYQVQAASCQHNIQCYNHGLYSWNVVVIIYARTTSEHSKRDQHASSSKLNTRTCYHLLPVTSQQPACTQHTISRKKRNHMQLLTSTLGRSTIEDIFFSPKKKKEYTNTSDFYTGPRDNKLYKRLQYWYITDSIVHSRLEWACT